MSISLSEEAIADAQHTADWYIDQGAWDAAVALHIESSQTLTRLLVEPGLGTPGPDRTRILPVHRFPVSVVYRNQGGLIRVIAIASQRRKPGYWAGRR